MSEREELVERMMAQVDEQIDRLRPLAAATCPQCSGWGWWVDDAAQKRGEKFFFYCACAAGIRVQEEDGGGD
jgi:hypothetical protein